MSGDDVVTYRRDPDVPGKIEIVFAGRSLIVLTEVLRDLADLESGFADRGSVEWARTRDDVAVTLVEEAVGERLREMQIN